jgi:hypothetical protein
MKRSVLIISAAALGAGAYSTAQAYTAEATVTFAWGTSGTQIGWTSNGANTLPVISNTTEFWTAGGNNSTTYFNADFAIASDYDPGTDDDCLTPLPNYENITLRKYACRHQDAQFYYGDEYNPAPVSDIGPGAAASGTLTVTDTTLTGTLTVVTTTDEPTGATTTFISGVRTSNSASDGLDGFNVRTADGSPFGNAWYGVTTAATLTVNLTGTFSATNWTIDGGAVTFSDPGFACQQGGFGGSGAGTLCTPSGVGGGFSPSGGHLSWGIDTDGAGTGTTVATPIVVQNVGGDTTLATLGGVLANLSLDGGGAITTDQGEYRIGTGSSGGGCPTTVRWGPRPSPETANGITCGTLAAGPLEITGTATEVPPDTDPDPFTFTDQTGVALSALITSAPVTITGINADAPVSVTGGEYSVGCTATFTAVAGTVGPDQQVCVRHTSAATGTTDTDTVLTVGGVSDTFTSTTEAEDTTPDAFTFIDATDVGLGLEQLSNAITVAGINTAAPISVTGGEYRINAGPFTSSAGTVVNGDEVVVRHTSAATPATATNTVLTIGGVSDTFTSTTVPPDSTPDPFAFTDVVNVALSTLQTSNTVTITGINTDAAISVTGGEYSINGGAFTAAAGTVVDGDDVAVRHTSSGSFSTAVNTVLTVGGVSDTYTSTTLAADTTPNAFSFTDVDDVDLDTEQVSNAITVAGINSPAPISVTGGEYAVNGGAFTAGPGTVNNGDSVVVRHTSADTEGTTTNTVLTIGGISGTFTSTTLVAQAPGSGLREDDGGSSLDALLLALLGISVLVRRRQR